MHVHVFITLAGFLLLADCLVGESVSQLASALGLCGYVHKGRCTLSAARSVPCNEHNRLKDSTFNISKFGDNFKSEYGCV